MPKTSKVETKIVALALITNLILTVLKLAISLITASAALLAEAVHSLADTTNQVLLLLGISRSRKRPTDLHPFGYGKESYFWSFIVASLLFILGSLYSLYNGIQRILNPEPLTQIHLAFIIIFIAITLESIPLYAATKAINKIRKGNSIFKTLQRLKSPELLVVFLEDSGAILGLIIALIGISLATILDQPVYDGIASVVIGILLACMAVFLAMEIKSLLIGERATKVDEYKIVKAIRERGSATQLIDVKTLQMGPENIIVAIDCHFPDYMNTLEIEQEIDGIEHDIRQAVPEVKRIYIEPESMPKNGLHEK